MPSVDLTFANESSTITFSWETLNTSLARKWFGRLMRAKIDSIAIDDPKRFYGFNSPEIEAQIALDRIQHDIRVINAHEPIIERCINRIDDQDTLNYLHHIFEVYHGLLDSQTHEFWLNAPDSVRQALARLNVNVHRCENAYRLGEPMFISTFYNLPKDTYFSEEDYNCLSDTIDFGTMCLNYAEIGKTLWDHYTDDDPYIHSEAFKPFYHCSADFNVNLYSVGQTVVSERRSAMWEFFETNITRFEGLDITSHDIRHEYGCYPLAVLNTRLSQEAVVEQIRNHQHIIEWKIR